MGTKDLTHEAIARALTNGDLLTHEQRSVLLGVVADDAVWQRKHDEMAEQLACVRQALPEEWRGSVPSVAVATLTAELGLLRQSSATYFAERNSARDAWRDRKNQCEVLARWIAEVLPALDVADALEDFEDGGEHLRMLKDRGERLVAAVIGLPATQQPNGPQCNLNTPWLAP